MKWSYKQGDKELGPVSKEEILRLFDEQQINGHTPVWREGMAKWKPINTIPSLVASLRGDTTPMPDSHDQNLYNPWAEQYGHQEDHEKHKLIQCTRCSAKVDPKKLITCNNTFVCPKCHAKELSPEKDVVLETPKQPDLEQIANQPVGAFKLIYLGLCRLSGQWIKSIVFSYTYFMTMLVLAPLLIFTGILMVGKNNFWLHIAAGKRAKLGHLFSGFSQFFKSLSTSVIVPLILISWTAVAGFAAYFHYPEIFAPLATHVTIDLNNLSLNPLHLPTIDLSDYSFDRLGLQAISLLEAAKSTSFYHHTHMILATLFLVWLVIFIYLAMCISQVFYLLADNNPARAKKVFRQSNQLMRGNKLRFFNLTIWLMLIGAISFAAPLKALTLLSIPNHLCSYIQMGTIVIVASLLCPFINATLACFYHSLQPSEQAITE